MLAASGGLFIREDDNAVVRRIIRQCGGQAVGAVQAIVKEHALAEQPRRQAPFFARRDEFRHTRAYLTPRLFLASSTR